MLTIVDQDHEECSIPSVEAVRVGDGGRGSARRKQDPNSVGQNDPHVGRPGSCQVEWSSAVEEQHGSSDSMDKEDPSH